jgi:hypothetical protein
MLQVSLPGAMCALSMLMSQDRMDGVSFYFLQENNYKNFSQCIPSKLFSCNGSKITLKKKDPTIKYIYKIPNTQI